MHRQDGRGPEEFRPACLQQAVLTRAQGSAFVELGKTKVIVGVFGPREHSDHGRDTFSSIGRTSVDVSIVTFPRRPKMGPRKTREEVHLASVVHSAVTSSILLDRFPKLFVDINCTVLESDGAVASALILATSLALAHAGIDMKDTVSSCTVCVEKEGTRLFIDPSADEETQSSGTLLVAMAPSSGQMTYISSWGSWKEDLLQKAIHMAVGGCMHVGSEVKKTMVQQVMMDTETSAHPTIAL